ncbi:MAG: NAD(P)H-hydrate epimerase [Planctomycetes bacterium]|nr:NAD(P)H-hydrate epimerase [Planctomycetota bacterium]
MPKQPSISRAAMQEVEAACSERYAVPTRLLMENAGRAVADEVVRVLRAERVGRAVRSGLEGSYADQFDLPPEPRSVDEIEAWKASLAEVRGPVAIICGGGNNGGDGYVVARTLANQGVEVQTWFVGKRESLPNEGDAGESRKALEALGQSVLLAEEAGAIPMMQKMVNECAVVVDAIFGTGLSRTIEGYIKDVIHMINDLDQPCISVDIPSGIDADSGDALGTAILADQTITFGAAKHGLFRGHGPDHCGRVVVAEIGIPRDLLDAAKNASS